MMANLWLLAQMLFKISWMTGLGPAFAAIAIAESSMAVVSAVLFKQGRWKKKKI